MLNENHEFVVPKVGDVVLLKVNVGEGRIVAEMWRGEQLLYWGRETPTSTVRTKAEFFKGIMCPGELKQALMFVARAFHLRGIEPCEPDAERKKAGWIAFHFV